MNYVYAINLTCHHPWKGSVYETKTGFVVYQKKSKHEEAFGGKYTTNTYYFATTQELAQWMDTQHWIETLTKGTRDITYHDQLNGWKPSTGTPTFLGKATLKRATLPQSFAVPQMVS